MQNSFKKIIISGILSILMIIPLSVFALSPISSVETLNSGNITSTTARLDGQITKTGISGNGVTVLGYFMYIKKSLLPANTFFCKNIININQIPGLKETPHENVKLWIFNTFYSDLAWALEPDTEYYYCAVASEIPSGGLGIGLDPIKTFGTMKTFKTNKDSYAPGASIIAQPSSYNSILDEDKSVYLLNKSTNNYATDTTSKLSAYLNPENQETWGYFRYSSKNKFPPVFCNDIYGSNMRSTKEVWLGYGNSNMTFNSEVSDLDPDTTYYYCAVGTSKNKIRYSAVGTFTTTISSLNKMSVTTNSPTVVDEKSVYLNGFYNTSVPASTWFEYRKKNNQADSLDKQSTKNKKASDYAWSAKKGNANHNAETNGNLNFLLYGLSANTTYQYRAAIRGNSDLNTIYGEIFDFKTIESGDSNPGGGDGNNNNDDGNLNLGDTATPPIDAVVRYHEGIEHVFVRQIIGNSQLAKAYGYKDGMNIQTFAWDLADLFARVFGYVASSGKEIRVSIPDIAAYRLELKNGDLTVYEYYDGIIVNVQKMTEVLRGKYGYEYYFRK